MEITVVNDSQARLGLDVREVKIMQHIFAEVKDVLNHEAQSRCQYLMIHFRPPSGGALARSIILIWIDYDVTDR
jgi:hypothetical protein